MNVFKYNLNVFGTRKPAHVPSEWGYVAQFAITATAHAVLVILIGSAAGAVAGAYGALVVLMATVIIGAVPFLVVASVVERFFARTESQLVHAVATGVAASIAHATLLAAIGALLGGLVGALYVVVLWPWVAAAGIAAAVGRFAVRSTVPGTRCATLRPAAGGIL